MPKHITWFVTWLPLLKFAQAICYLLIIVVFIDGREQWFLYNQVFLLSFLALFFTLFSILARCFELETRMPFDAADMVSNLALTIVCLLSSTVLLWDIWNMRQGPSKYKYHVRLAPVNIGQEAWMRRCIIASTSLLLAGIMHIITYLKLYQQRQQ
ncbi:unnamed protein product [Caenorhabditis sp. 36 PRJEB53466]|nr:unnamed protein product [Caenorhabditis sp. 36 PRJEB53466]